MTRCTKLARSVVSLCWVVAVWASFAATAHATYWYDYYPGSACQPLWGYEEWGHRANTGYVYNPDSVNTDFVCPMVATDGTASWYDDVFVRVRDQRNNDAVECRVQACYYGYCQYSSVKASGDSDGDTGNLSIEWIDAFSQAWRYRAYSIWCSLPPTGGTLGGSAHIWDYYGERDWY